MTMKLAQDFYCRSLTSGMPGFQLAHLTSQFETITNKIFLRFKSDTGCFLGAEQNLATEVDQSEIRHSQRSLCE